MHVYIPGDWLEDLVWPDKVLHSHFHDWPSAGDNLLVEWIPKVDPQVLSILIDIPQSKIILLQNSKGAADLHISGKTDITLHNNHWETWYSNKFSTQTWSSCK